MTKAKGIWLAVVACVIVLASLIVLVMKGTPDARPGPAPVVPVAPKPLKVRVALVPITDCAQVYLAKELGVFDKHGLAVEIVPMSGGAAILPALSAGSVDVAYTNLVSVVFFQQNVGPLEALAGGNLLDAQHSECGLVVSQSGGVTDLAGLKDKKIAVNTKKNIIELVVRRTLRTVGVTPSDGDLVEIGFPSMQGALEAGHVNAVVLPEPFLSKALADGKAVSLGDPYVIGLGEAVIAGYFATPEALKANPDLFKKFNDAMLEVTPAANSYGDEVRRAIEVYTKVPAADLRKAGRPFFISTMPDAALVKMRQWMKEEGFISE